MRELRNKIMALREVARCLCARRAEAPCKVVHCHGVFDLLHVGHIKHLQAARAMGDLLVVTITPAPFVNKGPGRPAFGDAHRCEALAALECVDYVAVNESPTAVEALRLLKPDLYVKGAVPGESSRRDFSGAIDDEQRAVEAVGGRLEYTYEETYSSSTLINQHLPVLSDELKSYLDKLKEGHTPESIVGWLQCMGELKVLLVGEAIIDEYVYCETMGKSGKEPTLASRFLSSECHAGGVLAVANHLAPFCGQVDILTCLGADQPSMSDFARRHLDPAVNLHVEKMREAPTIVKRRFVEQYPFQKLFELYEMNDEPEADLQNRLLAWATANIAKYDAVVVADYGHGMIGTALLDCLCQEATFLAVNTQDNAGNHGFNAISRYPRADFVSLSEREIRLDARNRRGELTPIIRSLASRLHTQQVIVTRGQQGCVCFDTGSDTEYLVPALSSSFKDRVGAGDAMFGITSLCVQQGAPAAIVGLIGNAVGSQAVTIVGNSRAIDKVALLRHLDHLLK